MISLTDYLQSNNNPSKALNEAASMWSISGEDFKILGSDSLAKSLQKLIDFSQDIEKAGYKLEPLVTKERANAGIKTSPWSINDYATDLPTNYKKKFISIMNDIHASTCEFFWCVLELPAWSKPAAAYVRILCHVLYKELSIFSKIAKEMPFEKTSSDDALNMLTCFLWLMIMGPKIK